MRGINRQAGFGTSSSGGDNFVEYTPPVPKPSEEAMKRAIRAKELEKQRKEKERKKARAAAKKDTPKKAKSQPNKPKPSVSLNAEVRAIFAGRTR